MSLIKTPSLIELETPRLKLRQWQATDFAPFAQLNANAHVMQYFPSTLNSEQSNALAEKFQRLISQNGWGFWAIELKSTSEFIGFTGLHAQPEQFEFSPCVEIGWRLDQKFWNHGYAFEAAQACLDFAFNTLRLKDIVAFTVLQNTASEKLMQRLGMQFKNEFNHPALKQDSPLQRHILYKITHSEYLNQQHNG